MIEDHEYLPSFEQAKLYRQGKMNVDMKRCMEDEQEKCPYYEAKCSRPGHVDLTCLYYRKDFLGKNGGDICTAPPPKKDK